MGLVTRRVPRYTHEQERNGLLRIIEDFNNEGMTAVKVSVDRARRSGTC